MFKALKERFLCEVWQICYKHRRPNRGYWLGCSECLEERRAEISAYYARSAAKRDRIYQQLGVNQ